LSFSKSCHKEILVIYSDRDSCRKWWSECSPQPSYHLLI